MKFYPLKFYPIFKEKIWGGRNLKTKLEKEIPVGKKIGEAWELAYRSGGDISVIRNGIYKDLLLSDLIGKYKGELVGKAKMPKGKFPLLFKFIDANDELSIQVHPPDDYRDLENSDELGKTECWFIISAEKNAEITLGLQNILSSAELIKVIEDGLIEKYINRITVDRGDFIFLPPGVVHSIGKGILLAEIQENSDVTYRLWDWGRKDRNGIPRETHIRQAIEVLNIKQDVNSLIIRNNMNEKENGNKVKLLTNNDFFNVTYYDIGESIDLKGDQKFKVLLFIEGEGIILLNNTDEEVKKGDTVFIPAGLLNLVLKPCGRLIFLVTTPV